MPRFNGKYKVTAIFLEASIYTINMPNSTLAHMTFHTSELKPYHKNNASLFPSRELACPGLVITDKREEEWRVEEIIDKCGRGLQYLVTFTGFGPDHNRWMTRHDLLEMKPWITGKLANAE